MIVEVEMLAFGKGERRGVSVPAGLVTTQEQLDAAYYYGQNHIQPKPFPSVSVGDVIHLGTGSHAVATYGFCPVSPEQVQTLRDADRRDRADMVRRWHDVFLATREAVRTINGGE